MVRIGKWKVSVWWFVLFAWGCISFVLSVRDGSKTISDSSFIVNIVCRFFWLFGVKLKEWQIHKTVRKIAHIVIHVGVASFSYRAVKDTINNRILWFTATIGCSIGIVDEVIKVLVPGRTCDFDELVLNCVTVVVCCLFIALSRNHKKIRMWMMETMRKGSIHDHSNYPEDYNNLNRGKGILTKPKLLFVSSSGGHYEQLKMLKPLMKKYESVVVTEQQLCSGEADYYMIQINHSDKLIIFKLLVDCMRAIRIWIKEKPGYIISTGTMVALPFAVLAKLTRKKIIYIETFAKMYDPSMTGKLMYRLADLFIIQWESLREYYPNAVYGGCIY